MGFGKGKQTRSRTLDCEHPQDLARLPSAIYPGEILSLSQPTTKITQLSTLRQYMVFALVVLNVLPLEFLEGRFHDTSFILGACWRMRLIHILLLIYHFICAIILV